MNHMHRRSALAGILATLPTALALGALAQAETVLQFFPGPTTNLRFGRAVGGGADVDGDGHPDVIVGGCNTSVAGLVRVFSGSTGAVLFELTSSDPTEQFGASVCILGDVDGDGHADFAVGAPEWSGGPIAAGQVRVFSGADASLLFTLTGDSQADRIGYSLATAGDVDGDGFPDLIAGAPDSSTSGAHAGLARVYSGRTGAILYTFYGSSAGDGLGIAVAGAGDVDGDGHADLIVGAWEIGGSASQLGYARIFSGSSGSILHEFHGDGHLDHFGVSVAGIGDFDGDGLPDVAVGASENDVNGNNAGMIRVFSGATGTALRTLRGSGPDAHFGSSIASLGDLDGDQRPELVVGAPGETVSNDTQAGTARLFRSSDAAVFEVFRGDSAYDYFGSPLAAVGDVNGDGYPDFLVGAPGDDPRGAESGSARLISGRLGNASNFCISTPNSTGGPATIGYSGSLSVGANQFTLITTGVPTHVFGLFFYSQTQALAPLGNGYRCLGGHLFRLHAVQAVNGVLTRTVDFTNPPPNGAILPASTWNFQCFYRDPDPSAAPFYFNLSDGLTASFTL
jgi:hypothetical protein